MASFFLSNTKTIFQTIAPLADQQDMKDVVHTFSPIAIWHLFDISFAKEWKLATRAKQLKVEDHCERMEQQLERQGQRRPDEEMEE